MKFTKYDILIVLCITTFLAAYNLWSVFNFIERFFSRGVAIGISIACLIILNYAKDYSRSKFTIRASYFLFFLSLNNILDNLLFDPYVIQWNEYVFGVVAFIASIIITRNYPKNAKI